MKGIASLVAFGVAVLTLAVMITANATNKGGGGLRELTSLKTAPIPPTDFSGYLKPGPEARKAVIALGKALYWDMQAGGDGKQACASCHFDAGADSRYKGQMNPGVAKTWQGLGGGSAANYIPAVKDYPFHKLANPDDRNSPVISNTQNVTGSQGLYHEEFIDVVSGSPEDAAFVIAQTATPDPYGIEDRDKPGERVSTRHTTGRNSPSVINAVFNYRNFYDGRAQNMFNGVSPFGDLDKGAFVLVADPKTGNLLVSGAQPAHQVVRIANAALASQAVGPPNNDVEMSYVGRDFKKLGKKMLALRPLALQSVAPDDSVLGPYSNQRTAPGAKGINASYAALIQASFQPKWWNSKQLVDANGKFVTTAYGKKVVKTGTPGNTNEFTLMESNFSLIWGIAIQMYESRLVSDDSRFDRFMDGDRTALTDEEQDGLIIFLGKGNCIHCHMGPEMTDAAVGNLTLADEGDPGNPAAGFHNLGVRPVSELQATGSGAPGAVTTATKTPGLRNVELTAPYFHNGGQLTLEQVVDFYGRGGDFGTRDVDQDTDINFFKFKFSAADKTALVAFLKSLTDKRVLMQSAPFDHPSLDIPNGAAGNNLAVTQNGATGIAMDDPNAVFHLPATGQAGTNHPLVPFAQHLR